MDPCVGWKYTKKVLIVSLGLHCFTGSLRSPPGSVRYLWEVDLSHSLALFIFVALFLLARILQRNWINRISLFFRFSICYLSIYHLLRLIYFKELAHKILEGGKSKIKVDWPAGSPGKSQHCSPSLRPSSGNIPSYLGAVSHLVLFRLSIDWTRPTHIRGDILLYSKSTDLNLNPIQKHPLRTT